MKARVRCSLPVAAGLGFLVFIGTSTRGLSAPQSQSEQRLSAIKGIVTNAVTGDGLRKAFVMLSGKSGSFPAVTDDGGRFAIENVQPGKYSLGADCQGFIQSLFGEEPGVRFVEIQLTPGQILTDIKIKLTPQGVISGRVVDEDGDVWTHSQVDLFRSSFVHGRRQLEGFIGNNVNDQGEFRLGQLQPGKYYLSAAPDSFWESKYRPTAQRQRTWYPSALNVEGSTAIIVGPGDQLSGLEIRLHRGSVHAMRGTLVGSENIPDERSQFSGRNIFARASGVGGDSRNGVIHPDGTFEIHNLPAGAYEINVRQGFPPVNLGSAKVQVDDRDLEDVSIQLVPPRPLKGVIRIEEEGSAKVSGLTVRLNPLLPGWNPSTLSREDGSFEIPQVGSEPYRFDVMGLGHYLKEIRYGDVVSRDGTISLTGPVENLLLILSTRVARVTGKVIGNAITSTPQVVLVPSARTPGDPRIATFDQNGAFSLSDIPPGTYKLFAFEGVPDGAWEDSDFMKEISSSGTEIKLAEGDATNVDVPILLKSDLAPILKKLGME